MLEPVSSQSTHFDNEVEAYLASKDDKSERKLERNMFISQLTLYFKKFRTLVCRQLSQVANILRATPVNQMSVERLFSIVKFIFSLMIFYLFWFLIVNKS
jgi:hypothetical protein